MATTFIVMPSYITNNPQIAAQLASQGLVGQVQDGEQRFNQAGYLFSTGLNAQIFERTVMYNLRGQNRRYLLHTLMKHFDAREFPVGTSEFHWYEMNELRVSLLVSAVTAMGGATVDVTDTATSQRYIVGDVLYIGNNGGIAMRVEAVDTGGANPVYTVRKLDRTVFAAGDIVAGDRLGHATNVHAERTGQPVGRTWTPTPYSNRLGIIKRTQAYSGTALTTMTELDLPGGRKSYVHNDSWVTSLEFCSDRENMLFYSKEHDGSAGPMSPRGILDEVISNAASPTFYTGAAVEEDMQDVLANMNPLNDGSEFLLLAGQGLYNDLTRAMAPYYLNGAVAYGSFNGGMGDQDSRGKLAFGLGIRSYDFAGRTLHIVHFKQLDNVNESGSPAAGASATNIDLGNFGLVLNWGRGSNIQTANAVGRENNAVVPMVSYMYKELDGVNRSFVYAHLTGMTGQIGGQQVSINSEPIDISRPGNQVSTDMDENYLYLLSEIGVRMVGSAFNHSYMRRIG